MKTLPPAEPAPTADTAAARKALGDFRHALRGYIKALEAGHDDEPIIELPLHTRELVEALAAAAATHPELLAMVARDNVAWPVMAARHAPQGHDFAALADRIELGANVVVSVSPHASYRWDTPLNRFLLQVMQDHCLDTPKRFYFLTPTQHQPRLTPRSLTWYLDEFLMPLLDDLREEQGNWDGVPAVAALVKGVTGEAAQRRVVRKHIREALVEMAGTDGERSQEAAERSQETGVRSQEAEGGNQKPKQEDTP